MDAFPYISRVVIPAALSLLPARLNSPDAKAMLLAIGLQESRFLHRVQIGGPAHGFWQFEAGGGVRGVLQHPASRPLVLPVLDALVYANTGSVCYAAIIDNDVLACVFARLLLWTHPKALPQRGAAQYGWGYYADTWRPGLPHRATWDAFYAQAWGIV